LSIHICFVPVSGSIGETMKIGKELLHCLRAADSFARNLYFKNNHRGSFQVKILPPPEKDQFKYIPKQKHEPKPRKRANGFTNALKQYESGNRSRNKLHHNILLINRWKPGVSIAYISNYI